jgi:glycosyltransferase involved in cell wall biosynthesis
LSGGELALANLIAALNPRRWEALAILGQAGPLTHRLQQAGVEVIQLPLPALVLEVRQERLKAGQMLNPLRALEGLAYVARLAKVLRNSGVQLVHANSLRTCILGSLAARVSGVPSVWHVHSIVAQPMVAAAGVQMLRMLARWLPQHILCNSEATAACLRDVQPQLSVIPIGVDSRRFRSDERVPNGNPRIAMVGRFAPWKGQHIFVEAAARLSKKTPGAEFVLAGVPMFGEQAYAQSVRAQASQAADHARIQFLDFVDDIPALLAQCDIVVHASVQPEPFGQVIVEAMMAGKPVIASAAGGPVDLVVEGVTGRLVPPGNAGLLADALDRMIQDPAGAALMGQRGRERALERYDIRQTAAAVERVYERVLK